MSESIKQAICDKLAETIVNVSTDDLDTIDALIFGIAQNQICTDIRNIGTGKADTEVIMVKSELYDIAYNTYLLFAMSVLDAMVKEILDKANYFQRLLMVQESTYVLNKLNDLLRCKNGN